MAIQQSRLRQHRAIWALLLIAALTSLQCARSGSPTEKRHASSSTGRTTVIPFNAIAEAVTSVIREPRQTTIRTHAVRQQFWSEQVAGLVPSPALHQVDFRTHMLRSRFCAFGTVGGAQASSGDSSLSFESIAEGTTSGIVDPLEIVIQSPQEWQDLWKRHAPSGPPPFVDFAKEAVAGIFAGQRPTSGYQVQIVRVERGRTAISVIYQVKSPPKDALVAQVLTQPFHLIRLPRLGLPVQFRRL